MAGPALSRVNPLPQVPHRIQPMHDLCGSGFTREEAGTGCENAGVMRVSDVYRTLNYAHSRIPQIICAQARSQHGVDTSVVGRLPGAALHAHWL
ncbi:hypothetical protein CVV67_32790 [Arthrobacter stackebrandtii]|nr:hypothetical protein CVV67_32790 [Arthrobacter stackebrandtii]